MKVSTVMRSLRILHGISLKELAGAAGVSPQYMSNVELGVIRYKNLEEQMQAAFETLISERAGRLEELEKSYGENKERLLEESYYEL